MKRIYLLLFIFCVLGLTFQSCEEHQCDFDYDSDEKIEVLKLQPDAKSGKDAVVWTERPDTPIPNSQDLQAMAWTWYAHGYDGGVRRSLVDFDLSSIPESAKIVNATLYLYYNPTSGDIPSTQGHSQRDGSNKSILSRITAPWSEETVTWNTQPAVSMDNQIHVRASESATEDYAIDVKNLVEDMVANPSESFGFLYALANEDYYRAMIFASSDNANNELHPKLVVEYTEK